MSHLVARILLGALLVPLAYVVDVIAHVVLSDHLDSPTDIWAANCFAAGLLIICWWLLWRDLVSWSAQRTILTMASLAPAAVIGLLAGNYVDGESFIPLEVFIYVWISAFAWMFATGFIWRETARERAARLAGN